MSLRSSLMVSVAGLLVSAGAAHASFFSFASDTNDSLPTFVGAAGSGGSLSFTDAGPSNRFTLVIDDNNGPAPAYSTQVRLVANFTATWVISPVLAGNVMLHKYALNGSFSFVDASSGAPLLTGVINGGLFDAVGTMNTWASTANFSGSDSIGTVTYTSTQALVNRMNADGFNPAVYGIFPGSSSSPDDASFELSFLRGASGSVGVSIDPQTKLPTSGWTSESSFSGSAVNGVPTPGAASLLAIGGLIAMRRRRA